MNGSGNGKKIAPLVNSEHNSHEHAKVKALLFSSSYNFSGCKFYNKVINCFYESPPLFFVVDVNVYIVGKLHKIQKH